MRATWARGMALLLAGALAAYPAAAALPAPNRELTAGISLVKAGDFESAIPILSAAIQALSPDLKRREELAQAFLYLGVAYLELSQELEARGKFREAIRNDPKLKLSPQEFSGQVIRVFEAERLAAQPEKKKRNWLPLVLVIGGSTAASVGIAAAKGGDSPSPTSLTTTTTLPPSPSPGGSTTTTTAPPGPDPTTPGSTTTTSTTSTTTTTTTTMPSCRYSLSPDRNFPSLGGNSVCNVDVTPQNCPWTAEVSPPTAGWLTMTGATLGMGDGSVTYSVALNLGGGSRAARIRLQQDPGASCFITQDGVVGEPSASALTWASQLELPGGRGQVLVNGTEAYGQEGALLGQGRASRAGWNRIEAHLVRGGRPGTWTFEILSGHAPGSLRALAGKAVLAGPGRIVFQLSGEPGERVAFVFRSAR